MIDAFEQFKSQALLLSKIMDDGHITFDEVREVVKKMANVRSVDDGFGKVVVEMTRTNNQDIVRVRMIQDKILKPLAFERE